MKNFQVILSLKNNKINILICFSGSTSKHKKDGCSACDSEITCYLPDPSKPCRCPWHKNDELLKKWKTELKIYKSALKCTDFPDMKVIIYLLAIKSCLYVIC